MSTRTLFEYLIQRPVAVLKLSREQRKCWTLSTSLAPKNDKRTIDVLKDRTGRSGEAGCLM